MLGRNKNAGIWWKRMRSFIRFLKCSIILSVCFLTLFLVACTNNLGNDITPSIISKTKVDEKNANTSTSQGLEVDNIDAELGSKIVVQSDPKFPFVDFSYSIIGETLDKLNKDIDNWKYGKGTLVATEISNDLFKYNNFLGLETYKNDRYIVIHPFSSIYVLRDNAFIVRMRFCDTVNTV